MGKASAVDIIVIMPTPDRWRVASTVTDADILAHPGPWAYLLPGRPPQYVTAASVSHWRRVVSMDARVCPVTTDYIPAQWPRPGARVPLVDCESGQVYQEGDELVVVYGGKERRMSDAQARQVHQDALALANLLGHVFGR